MRHYTIRSFLLISLFFASNFLNAAIPEQLLNEFLQAIDPIQKVVGRREPMLLSDFLDSINIPVPGKMKSALNNVVIDSVVLFVDTETASAQLRGQAEIFGQDVVVKVRIGYGSKGVGKDEPNFISQAYMGRGSHDIDKAKAAAKAAEAQRVEAAKQAARKAEQEEASARTREIQSISPQAGGELKGTSTAQAKSGKQALQGETKTLEQLKQEIASGGESGRIKRETSQGQEELAYAKTQDAIRQAKQSINPSASAVTASQQELQQMAPLNTAKIPVASKSAVVAQNQKTEGAFKDMFQQATGTGKYKPEKEKKTVARSIKDSITDIAKKFNISLTIGVLGAIKLGRIEPALTPLDAIEFSNLALVFASGDFFDDIDFGRTFYKGVNILGTARLSGPLEKVNDFIGSDLTMVTLKGVLAPTIVGSMLTAELPGKIKLGPTVETSGLFLCVALEQPLVSISVLTGLNVQVPQSDPLEFRAGIKYIPPTEFVLGGWMDGMWNHPFGVPYFGIGELGVQAGIDITTAAQSLGILSLSTIGMRGKVGFGDKTVEVATSISVAASSPDLLLSGKFEGGLGTQDVVNVAAAVIDQAAKVGGKNLGLRDKVKGKVPNIGITNAELYFSPKAVLVAGRFYPQGVGVAGGIELLGQKADLDIRISPYETSAQATMSEINLGPLKFTGAGKGQVRDGVEQGPIVSFTVGQDAPYVQLFIDARAELNVLGGLVGDTRINFSIKGIEFWLETQIFNQFMSYVEFSTPSFFKPKDWRIICRMKQEGLDNFAKLLQKGAEEMAKAADRDIAKAQEGVEKAKQALDKIKDERRKIEQENARNVNGAISEMRSKIDSLKREKDALEEQIRKCKGQAPKEAKEEVGKRIPSTDFEPTNEQIKKAVQGLAAQGFNKEQIEFVEKAMWARAGARNLAWLRGAREAYKKNPKVGQAVGTLAGALKGIPGGSKAGGSIQEGLGETTDWSPAGREKDIERMINKLIDLGMPRSYVDEVREMIWNQDITDMMNTVEANLPKDTAPYVRFTALLGQRKDIEQRRTTGLSQQAVDTRWNNIVAYVKDMANSTGYAKGLVLPEELEEYLINKWLLDFKQALQAKAKK